MTTEISKPEQPILMDDVPVNRFHFKMTALTFGAHFTDGYAIGSISMALAILTPALHIGAVWQGLLGCSALIGLFFGSFILGQLSDRIGRQKIFLVNFAMIAVLSLLQIFVTNLVQLFILRVCIGFFLGGDYSVGVSLLCEVLPKKQRGLLLGCMNVMWNIGYILSTILGYFIQVSHPNAWNWLLASATIPAIIVLFLRIGTPESPRWLVRTGRREEAQKIVDKYIAEGAVIEEPNHTEEGGFRMLFTKKYRKQTTFASLFFVFTIVPFFAIYTFLPTILSLMGMEDTFSVDVILNVMLLTGSILGMWATVALSRRTFTIGGFIISAIGLLMLTFLPHSQTVAIIIAFIIFTLALNALINLVSVIPPEVLPTEVRATGDGFATAMSRLGSAVGTFILPISLTTIGIKPSMFILAMICALCALMCYFWAPETKDLTLTGAVEEAVRFDAKIDVHD